MPRQTLSGADLRAAIDRVIDESRVNLDARMQEKGSHTFVSSHEALGIIAEEYAELIDAVRGKQDLRHLEGGGIASKNPSVESELDDIIVACLWAKISMQYMDW